jgi:hypothetical protein
MSTRCNALILGEAKVLGADGEALVDLADEVVARGYGWE